MKGMMRFGKSGKPSTRYIASFDIYWIVREVIYEVVLPPYVLDIHPVLHVSILWHMLHWDSVQLDGRLTFVEDPVSSLARDIRWLHSRDIFVAKVL